MLDKYNYTEQESGRTETLIKAIERIELLQKQLRIALAAFRMIRYGHDTIKDKTGKVYYTWHYAEMKIKEMNNGRD